MNGIFGIISVNKLSDECIIGKNKIVSQNAIFNQNMIHKFEEDHSFTLSDQYITVLDGCILNLKSLLNKYQCDIIDDLIITMFSQNGKHFFKEFRGNFCGCIHNIVSQETVIFTDHFGSKQLYYCETEKELIFSSNIAEIVNYLNGTNDSRDIDLAGAYSMLSYGYMYHNVTMFKGIYKLLPGHLILIKEGEANTEEYYRISNSFIEEISEQDALEKLDSLFMAAVKLQADKNFDYGYLNYAPLSAGLDSRMTVYALNRLGVDNVINLTYSESGQLDHITPMKIAKELGNQWLFKNLDNGLDLLEIEESIKISDSRIYYPWSSQLNEFMKLISTDRMGIVHTGVIGDVVVGTFYPGMKDFSAKKEYRIGDGAFSHQLIHKVKEYSEEISYDNYEIGMLYNRAINGACMGYSTTFQNYTEAMSPFMNLEFFEFCLRLPLKYRLRHEIYYDWIKKYYPLASQYSHNGLKIHLSNTNIKINDKLIYIDTIPSRINIKLMKRIDKKYGMNPFQYWYDTNVTLSKKMDNYFINKKKALSRNIDLKKDVEYLYKNGSAIEKTLCISLVGSLDESGILC